MSTPKQIRAPILFAILFCPPSAHAEPVDHQVSFNGAGGTKLSGTLVVPKQTPDARSPAMVLVAGSGPTDRNGNQPPLLVTDLLQQIATALARHGVASLRYDKRGMHANAGELPKDLSQYGEFFSWENFVGDVEAACQFLRQRPEIDAERVGILGHSEGGVLALSLDAKPTAGGARPAALVLVSTPGRPLDAVVHDQLVRLLAQQKATPEQTKFFLEADARIVQAIKETGKVPLDVPAGLAALYPSYLGRFLQSNFATDPGKIAARTVAPVLVIAGEKDIQVSPERDSQALAAALSTRTLDDHKLLVVPGASHNLKPVKDDAEAGFAGHVPADVLDQIGQWAAAKLAR
jgi:uncharacterized protein